MLFRCYRFSSYRLRLGQSGRPQRRVRWVRNEEIVDPAFSRRLVRQGSIDLLQREGAVTPMVIHITVMRRFFTRRCAPGTTERRRGDAAHPASVGVSF